MDRALNVNFRRVLTGRVSFFWVITIWSICALSAYLVVGLTLNPTTRSLFKLEYWQSLLKFGESMRLVQSEYVDKNLSSYENLTNFALQGMVGNLDRHSSFFEPKEYRVFRDDTRRRYVGIGIMIRKIEKGILITKVFSLGPAEKVGLQVGEFILEVEGVPVSDWELDEVSNRIKGVEDTSVKILIRTLTGEDKLISIPRRQIEISSVDEFSVDENGTGHMHLMHFTKRTGEEVREAISQMLEEGMLRLVLDLRDNSGGLLTAAIEVAEIFLPRDQLIVSIRGRKGSKFREYKADSKLEVHEFSLVTIINEGTASASEIVAGSLSVTDRAHLIGEKSFGKGSVQTIFPLQDDSGIKLTTAMYYLPDGSTIHERGLSPKVLVPCSEEEERKLRIQRNGNRNADATQFEELFGFKPIVDYQLQRAKEYLLMKDNSSMLE